MVATSYLHRGSDECWEYGAISLKIQGEKQIEVKVLGSQNPATLGVVLAQKP